MTRRALIMAAALAVVAAVCADEDGSGTTPARASSSTTIAALPSTTTTTAPAATTVAPTQGVPAVDLSRHSVPLEEIFFDTFDGGIVPLAAAPPALIEALRDAIPPIDAPRYLPASGGDWLSPDDFVLGYVGGGQAYAFPIKILDLHEIVNDTIDATPVLISYCPLCRSGIVYDRRLEGRTLSFGNTSALYESDLVMLDRETGSYWWQVAGEAIVGELTSARLEPLPSTMAPWAQWKETHPDTLILSRETGFVRDYERERFLGIEDFLNGGNTPFPVSAAPDGRLAPAELVLGIAVDGVNRVYPLNQLGDGAVNDIVAGTAVVVFTAADGPTGAAYSPLVAASTLSFEFAAGAWKDTETGSTWNLSGLATDGELAGTQLAALPNRITFWFAYAGAFPDAAVAAG